MQAPSATDSTSVAEAPQPEVRLAGLEAIVLTAGAALRHAPDDDVLRDYYVAALTQRDALVARMQTKSGLRWF